MDSAETPTPNTVDRQHFVFSSAKEIAESVDETIRWVAKPWVGPGLITEVIGPPKRSGKTTWITYMARCVLDGKLFMGEPTEAGPVVYLTEQSRGSLKKALKKADLLEREDFRVLTWGEANGAKWPVVAQAAVDEAVRVGAKMLVVDTLAPFAGLKGDAENNAGDALAAVEPLKKAAHNHDIAVVMVRHARKGGGEVGESGRGSSAFIGEVDIHLSITKPGGEATNVRKIESLTRFDDTPDSVNVELTDSGYVQRGSDGKIKYANTVDSIKGVLSFETGLTEKEIVDQVDAGRDTVQRALNTLLEAGEIDYQGRGVKGDPKRYYLGVVFDLDYLLSILPIGIDAA